MKQKLMSIWRKSIKFKYIVDLYGRNGFESTYTDDMMMMSQCVCGVCGCIDCLAYAALNCSFP